jgi:plastocyanin
VAVSETEYKLDPTNPTVETGTVTVQVSNDGAEVHALEVEGPGVESETEDIQPGESASLTVDLSQPGTYEWYCPIANHKELGMEGEIKVAGAAGAAPPPMTAVARGIPIPRGPAATATSRPQGEPLRATAPPSTPT